MKKAAIFDMDGLMFDTERIWKESWNTIVPKYGYEPAPAFPKEVCGTSGEHTLAVTAVYEGGMESAPATAVIDVTSGISEISIDGQPVDVYTVDGRLVRRQATSLQGLKGLYLIGNKKVFVK